MLSTVSLLLVSKTQKQLIWLYFGVCFDVFDGMQCVLIQDDHKWWVIYQDSEMIWARHDRHFSLSISFNERRSSLSHRPLTETARGYKMTYPIKQKERIITRSNQPVLTKSDMYWLVKSEQTRTSRLVQHLDTCIRQFSCFSILFALHLQC